ncbi:MAG: hypothetical protein HDR18_02130 [Lachnospiraceae bacterium]|nr:hypothetical protein [Lachnospiraceae bacterium]
MNRLGKYVKTALCVVLSVTMILMDVPSVALALEETPGQTQETVAEEIIDGTDTNTGTDTDTGTDNGTGNGTDTETDAGSEGDTDTDTDSGSNTDADTDTDSGSDTDTDTGTGSESDADTDIDAGSDTSNDIDTDDDMDADTEAKTDMDGDSDKKEAAAEKDADVSVMNDDLSVEAANGLGSLLMDELQFAAQEGESEAQAGYAISEINVAGSTAEVTLHAKTSCTVIVSIYEENSDKPLVFGSTSVDVGNTKVRVQFEIDQMPQYFVVKGYIVATGSLCPLSKEYVTIRYTEAMQAFLKKTTDDFDPEKVLNLDEDKKTNFAVVGDDNHLVTQGKDADGNSVNVLAGYDDATRTYTFQNVDENIWNLKKGDVLVYCREENDIFVITVDSITLDTQNSETTAVIIAADSEMSVEDVFSYIKIEETVGNESASEIDPDSCPEGVTYLGRGSTVGYAISGEENLSYTPDNFEIDFDKLKLDKKKPIGPIEFKAEGKVTASASLNVKVEYYFDLHPFDDAKESLWHVDISFFSVVGIEGTIEISGEFEVPLCAPPAPPVEITSSILTVKYIPTFVISMTFEGTLGISDTVTVGVRFGNDKEESGLYVDHDTEIFDLSAELDGYLGLDFNPQLKVPTILEAELEMGIHLGVEEAVSNDDEDHDCGLACISGGFYLGLPFDGKLKVLKLREINLDDELKIDGNPLKWSFGEFYYSIKYREFGWGSCPYVGNIEVTVQVLDADGKPVEGAVVSTNHASVTAKTDSSGIAKIKAPRGEQSFFAAYCEKDAIPQSGSVSISVDGNSAKCVITLGAMNANLPGGQKVVDLRVNNIKLFYSSAMARMEDGSLYMWGCNDYGVLGNSSTTDRSDPVRILGQVKEAEISGYTCASVTYDGMLYMWGRNDHGQLGQGKAGNELSNMTVPTIVSVPGKVKKVAIYDDIAAAITEDNVLYMWGYNYYGRLGTDDTESINKDITVPTKIMDGIDDVKVSAYNTMVLTTDGKVYIWGRYEGDRLGDGTKTTRCAPDLENPIRNDAKKIALSNATAAVITKDGSLYMWGANAYGQLGINNTQSSYPMTMTTNITNVDWITLGTETSAAKTTDGSFYMWGRNNYGVLGDGTTENKTSPYRINNPQYILGLSWGFDSNVSLTAVSTQNHEAWDWGGGTYISRSRERQKILENVKLIEIGENNDYFVAMTDGSLWQYESNTLTFMPLTTVADTLPQNVYAVQSENLPDDYQISAYALSDYRSPKTFEGLVPNKLYNFYAMKSRTASSPLENDNMLSIAQGTADENGSLTVSFTLREKFEKPDLFVVGQTQKDISENLSKLQVSGVDDMEYSGTDQYVAPVVIYDGQTLREGIDYYLSGDYSAKEIGSYTVMIVGMGIYSGVVAIDYQIIPVREPVAAPTADKSSGSTLDLGDRIALECQTPEAVIRYTIDGTEPVEDSPVYEKPIVIIGHNDGTIIIKAVASREGMRDSEIATFTYTVSASPDSRIVIFDSDGGTTVDPQVVENGKTAAKPEAPVKEGFRFIGWYLDDEPYDFNNEITESITLKARWEEAPVISVPAANIPSGRSVAKGTSIILSCAEPGALIYYTVDGSEPDRQSNIYRTPIKITEELVIRAFASKEGFRDSETVSFSYRITTANADDTKGDDYDEILTDDIPDEGVPEGLWIAGVQQSYPYTGKAVVPQVRVYSGSIRLREGRDYTIRCKNNIKASDKASITVQGKGNFSGTETATFRITPLDLNDSSIEVEDITVAYNRKVQTPMPTVTFNGKKLANDRDYTVSYVSVDQGVNGANREVGEYEIELNAKQGGNFSGSRTIRLIVTDKTLISLAKAGKIANQPYNGGAEVRPAVAVTVKGKGTLIQGQDYTLTYQKNTEIGTAYAVLTGIGNYAGTKKIPFKITGQPISKAAVSGLEAVTYNGTEQRPKLTVTLNGSTLVEGRSYKVEYTNNTKVGKATVTITGINDCTGSVKKTFRILPFDLAADARADETDRQITGLEENFTVKYIKGGAKPIPTLAYNGVALKVGTDYTISYKNNKKPAALNEAKAPSFTVKGKGNFKGTVTRTFTIEAKAVDDTESPVTIKAPDVGYVDKAGKYVVKPVLTDADGTKLVYGKDYNNIVYSRQDGENEVILTKQDKAEAGMVINVRVSGMGVYTGGVLQTSYKVTPSDFSKAKIVIKPQEYTGNAVYLDKSAIQSVKVNGSDITVRYGTGYEVVQDSYKNNIRKGTASVDIRGMGGYGGTITVKFKITAKKFNGFQWFWK